MPHPYLLSLCQEYIELVDMVRTGRYDADDWRELDSQRQVTHNQLLDITGLTRDDDMYAYARAVVLDAKGRNLQ